ncbi:hypothetical protein F5877DRAFT_64904 [Lentinula edodes]|nr:hypothetical protein F5877DRAFT_64904 [Lentinula edodes]
MSLAVPSRNTWSRRLGMGGAGTDGAKATDSAKDSAAQDKPSSYDEFSLPMLPKLWLGLWDQFWLPIRDKQLGLVSQSGNNPTGPANADEVSNEDVNRSNVDEINEIPLDFHLHLTLKMTDKTRKDLIKPDKLTKEQKATVKAAEQRMTPAQHEIINNRNLAIQKQQQARSYSKLQDRRKSRNSKSEHSDLGTDDSANEHQKTKTSSRCISKDVKSLKPISSCFAKKIKDIAKGHETMPNSTTYHSRHLSTQPVDQLPQDSLLTRMIKTKKRSKKSIKNHKSSSDSDADSESLDSESCSESTSSNSSLSSSSSELDSSDESVQHRKQHRHHSRSHSQKRGGRKSKKRTYNRIIKPVSPSIWNGEADAEIFQRIVLEGYEFCKEGKIPKNEWVFLISHYLSGKAYQFFALKVAKNHSKWSLQEFYEGLFNYCFPVNHHEQM